MKEKYISKRFTKKGTPYFQVFIRSKNQSITKVIPITDYPSEKEALMVARAFRQDTLEAIHNGLKFTDIPTADKLFDRKFDIFAVNFKTKKNHTSIYNIGKQDLGNKKITDITLAELQSNINKYAETHSAKMISHYISIWKQIYKTAQMDNIAVKDITILLKTPKSRKITKSKPVDLSDDDFDKFLDAVKRYNAIHKDGAYNSDIVIHLLLTMYYTGIRPAECLALTEKDIDFENNTITINKIVGSSTTEKGVLTPPKNENAKRIIPLSKELKTILGAFLCARKQNKNYTGILFTDKEGNLLDIDYLSNYIRLVSRQCGIPFNMYMLRHKFSTELFKAGENPRVIQDLMGHGSQSMSLYYARSNKEDRENAVNKITIKKNRQNRLPV